ncbi:tumor necrosis factor receptor superfamily member 10A-like isoform X3 [Pteropus medius]|uniref:tumor necrosis factor receptor superfamily member 10A-like isoform X3 n=1 Tax=Pteropus vampyrus TaxID=132908 RepID=UPI00196B884C|nr:tumor necrosis factor receptor superfamily member 10A-like isoform X3 [Pteropus giganteus]
MIITRPCILWCDLKQFTVGDCSCHWISVYPAASADHICMLSHAIHRRRILQACGVDPKRVDRVFSWCSCPRRGPGARDNAHNEIVSNRNSQSTLVSEQELEQQEHAELAHVIVQSPGEAMRLLVPSASAATTGQDRVHQQLTAPQECRWSLPGKCCPPGYYLSEYTGDCMSCTDGVDFTNHSNNFSACRMCSQCYPGEVQTRSCTRIQDTECQCKPGTYRERNSPELCRPCSSGCPDGMVQAKPCTPWSNLKCVKRESSNSQLVTGVIGGVAAFFLCILLLFCAYRHWRRILQACGVDPTRVDRVFSWYSCPRRGPGARDNAHNEIVSNRNSQSTLVSEQELEQQEHTELAHVIVQSPGEAMHLLGPAGARRVSDEKQAAGSSNAVGHH